VRPQTGEPYIKSLKSGKNTVQVRIYIQSSGSVSPPQFLTILYLSLVQDGRITHAFIFEFENAEDFAYYSIDPVSTSDVSAFT
jgi:hypothetical protein